MAVSTEKLRTPEAETALEFAVNPQDPLYDALWYIKDAGLNMSVKPNGQLSLKPGKQVPPELDKLLTDNPTLANRLKMRVGHPQNMEDRVKYFYQEHVYPLTPWEPFVNPKAPTSEKVAAALMMGQEWLNPAASKVGGMLEKGGESVAKKVLGKTMTKNRPLAEALEKLVGRATPELVRGATTATGAEIAGDVEGEPFGQGLETGVEMEGVRGLLGKGLPHAGRFLNKATLQASADVAKTEAPALNILHHPEFDLKNKNSYYSKWVKQHGRNWIAALKQMSWDDFRSIFGHRYEEEMEALPDQMYQQVDYEANKALREFNKKYNIQKGANPPVQWTSAMQKDWADVQAAQNKSIQAAKDRLKIDKLRKEVMGLNDKARFSKEGEKAKNQIDLFDMISSRKEQIRRLIQRNTPSLMPEYDRINHDYEQSRSLMKFSQDPNLLTKSGDLNTQYVQKRLLDQSPFFRDKFGSNEFDELNNAFRRGDQGTAVDQPGYFRRGGSTGAAHISEGGPTMYQKVPIPTRENPLLTKTIGQQVRHSPNVLSRGAFTLLDPHMKEVFDKLNPTAKTEDKSASGQ